ncbi:HTH domain-containing protein [Mycobacterium timonense]|nr:HTH domain-containing protein [Mycobacterium timonense]
MPWRQAIIKALEDSGEPMHYAEIAQAIIDKELRTNVGATPAATVAATLSEAIRNDAASPFTKVERGLYSLKGPKRRKSVESVQSTNEAEETAREMGLINAFGMFWSRDQVTWKPSMPHLLGVQQSGSTPVNFTEQAGVYVLYDVHRPIYVGKVTEPRLGLRLHEHTRDRLTGRWTRFSWFGVRGVTSEGRLAPIPGGEIAVASLIATMEALLIEGLEPPQNRRQGDGFNAVEFIQVMDPDIEKEQKRSLLAQFSKDV